MARTADQVSLINAYDLDSPFATEFRRLLHNIKSASKTRELKTVLVTSSVVGEGKSTVCTFLAMTAARKHMRTLLVDCDLRRPCLHRLLGLSREKGVVEALSEGVAIRHTIKKSALDKLDLITAGAITPAPAELFDARSIGEFLAELKFYYDLILVDCAPILPVSDPMMLAQEVDGVILVIKAGATQRELVKRSSEILRSGTSRILGTVLNNMDSALPYYFDQSQYSYRYDTVKKKGKAQLPQPNDDAQGADTKEAKNIVTDKNRISG